MPFTEFIGVLTLAPAVCGLLALALGLLKRPLAPVVLALAILGAVIPAICLILLARDLTSGEPLLAVMYGGGSGSSGSFTPGYRFDALALYAALGLAFLVTPLLLWLAWEGDSSAGATDPSFDTADDETDAATDQPVRFARRLLPTSIWGGVTLALAVETAALTMLFADNALWLVICWLALAALIWGLGEIGSEVAIIDRAGLVMMLVGPLAWLVVMLFATHTLKTLSLADMMGRSGFNALAIILFAVALALAGGVYPFSAWVRRRAALITPAGLGALALIALPMTLYVGARTYAAGHDTADLWPQIGKATPPITGGIAFIVLGAVTVGIVGMLALERRDVRVLLAYLAVAQVGWGMVALGVGNAQGVLAMVVILATGMLGLGAMLAASVAGGTLTGDIEPDGAGPHVFGAPANRVGLIVWSLGALSLVGAPLMGGFVAREMVSAGAIHAGGLAIPLVGLAWAGDAVLALAILRATAPAFTDLFARRAEPVDDELEDEAADDDEAEIEGDERESAGVATAAPVTLPRLSVADLRYTPGVILAALALVVGVAPQLLLRFGATLAGNALLTSSGLDGATRFSFSGYSSGPGQWLPTLSWLGVVVLVALLVVVVPRGSRVAAPALAPEAAQQDDEDRAREMAGLAEPVDAWDELAPAMQSMWTLPGSLWLLAGTDEDEEPPVLANDENDENDEDLDEFEDGEPELDEPEADPDEVTATITQQANSNSADASDGRRRGRRSGENV